MAGRPMLATAALGVALAATARGAAGQPLYTLAATQSCLTRLPSAIAGLPPTTPPAPPVLFVYALARDDVSTWGIGQRRPRAHKQLGAWYGDRTYQGIILSFFKSASDAHASLKSLAWLYGGKLIRNVVATWDQKSTPSRTVRNTVFGCLRSEADGGSLAANRPASLATLTGGWGGHTLGYRSLRVAEAAKARTMDAAYASTR